MDTTLAVCILLLCASMSRAQEAADRSARTGRLRAADDARLASREHLDTIDESLARGSTEDKVLALRALGRSERQDMLARVLPRLAEESIEVKREAAFAAAQIARSGSEAAARARVTLADALRAETDGMVIAALGESLGRTPHPDAGAMAGTAGLLREAMARVNARGERSSLTVIGVARGAEALARQAQASKVTPPDALVSLLELLVDTEGSNDEKPTPPATRIRRLATAGLVTLRSLTGVRLETTLKAHDAQVRRLGVIALAQQEGPTSDQVRPLMTDEAMIVRHELVRRLGEKQPALASAALADPHLAVRLAAIDALGQARQCQPCTALVTTHAPVAGRWHELAHAVVALARTDANAASQAIDLAARAQVWQVRMYAARAAGATANASLLRTLAADDVVNVRHAALTAWREAQLPGVDDAALDALQSDDGQLVLAACEALEGTSKRNEAALAVAAALRRFTARRRETSRDVRVTLLERLRDLTPEDETGAVSAHLTDFDPVVARKAAEIRRSQLAEDASEIEPKTTHLPAAILPTASTISALEGRDVTLTLSGGRRLSIRLFAANAPTNVARFVTQVRAGEWDERTFHRVEPGFVVQGGSPSANEYAGASAFTRDEVSSLSHVRGTVGISTRGRDTGDGQIFINLVDNPRLDFTYTLIGTVVGDLAVLDDLVEGEVIERASLEAR